MTARPDFTKPITSLADAQSLIDAMVASGVMYDLGEDPEVIVEVETGERTFSDAEVDQLRMRVSALYSLDWGRDEDPIGYYLRVYEGQ